MNHKEKSNIFEAILLQKSMLELTGCWPKHNPPLFYKLKNFFFTILYLVVFLLLVFVEICYTFIHKDYQSLTELMAFFASGTSYVPKLFMFWYNWRKFLSLLQDLEDKKFQMHPFEFDKYIKESNKNIKLLSRFYQIVVLMFILILFLKPFYTSGETAVRLTICNLSHHWMILYHITEVCAIAGGCWNVTCLDALIIGLVSIATAQLKIVSDKLVNLRKFAGFSYEEVDNGKFNMSENFDEEMDVKIEERIKECVEHHLAIIRFLEKIEDMFTYTFLVQFFNSVVAICNTWFQFQLTNEWVKLAYLSVYSLALCVQIAFYCIYGDNLMYTSLEVQDACYNSEWYLCSPKVRKSLMIIMERTKRPVILTAGKFMVLNLVTYGALMRSSYSYFALMNQVNQ